MFDDKPMIAVYWSQVNMEAFRDGTSKLYYQIYQTNDGKARTETVLKKATEDVKRHTQNNRLPTEFGGASWVMVITWESLLHRDSISRPELKSLVRNFTYIYHQH